MHRCVTRRIATTRVARLAAALLAVSVFGSSGRVAAADHFPFGPLSAPRQIPAWRVTLSDGSSSTIAALLKGRVTALQLMFTTCSATCPLQGATFARAQQELQGTLPEVQFLSLSIDPAADSPVAMTQWLNTFGARAGWRGVTPKAGDLPDIFRVLGDGGLPRPEGIDPHSGQVYIVNRNGVLVYRTAAMPSARLLVEALRTAATTGWQ